MDKYSSNYLIVQNFDGRILMYTDFSNTWWKNILADGHYLSPCICKRRCNAFKNWQVKFWWSSWKCQKHQNFVRYGILKMTSTVDRCPEILIAHFTLKCMNIFRNIWQFMTSLPKVLPPAIFILSDLLCKAANLSIVFFAKRSNPSVLCARAVHLQIFYHRLIDHK